MKIDFTYSDSDLEMIQDLLAVFTVIALIMCVIAKAGGFIS